MPDQYTLAAFQRLELTPGHKPVMAEIDLTSSHTPWAPLPVMVPWNKVGNGSIFDPMPARGETPLSIVGNASKERQAFGTSMQYSLTGPHLMGHRAQRPEPRAHPARRPAARLALSAAPGPTTTCRSRSSPAPLPCSGRLSSWHWQNGLLPGPGAPLEPMDAFRNQFLDTFSTAPAQTASARTAGR